MLVYDEGGGAADLLLGGSTCLILSLCRLMEVCFNWSELEDSLSSPPTALDLLDFGGFDFCLQ